ncbi:hypothetical protein [Bifidobacterium castoris]|uniref:Uncharacterized protein n=1 Tax=Bifidobacterium castoris TaxID=2306972 RepID=A0A430F5H3_9BIFI|nr:hypothetical protein [Bifidobacterium castoris]RSX46124.1 hypothetical protein D2E22_1696 [Bifidobacterium castoris]
MVDTTALGVSAVRKDAGGWQGVDSLTHRKIIESHWASTGIVCGLGVSASDALQYPVAAGVAVTSRSGTDGAMEAYYAGGVAPAVEANQAANPRIDCIWLQAHNQKNLQDVDNLVVIGVTQGTPAASPTKPTPPAGVTVLSYMQVPANSTSLRNATRVGEIDYAVPYGVAQGLIASAQLKQDTTLNSTQQEWCRVQVNLPTDRYLECVITICASAAGANGAGDLSKYSEVGGQVYIDGNPLGDFFNYCFRGAWEPYQFRTNVWCGRGVHTVSVKCRVGYGMNANVHYNGSWSGIKLDVIDQGVKQ